jgi:hypothetical protein
MPLHKINFFLIFCIISLLFTSCKDDVLQNQQQLSYKYPVAKYATVNDFIATI